MKDYFGYSGKMCVVTGASSGMGRAACEMLVELGAEVFALSRTPCEVPGIKQYIQTDIADRASIDAAFKKLPEKIESFFGVAGISGIKNDFNMTFNVNFTANKYMVEEYLQKRMPSGSAIVFVTSTAGRDWATHIETIRGLVEAKGWEATEKATERFGNKDSYAPIAYRFGKLAMTNYAVDLAVTLGKQGIRVNVVLPGSTDTGMKDEFIQAAGSLEKVLANTGTANRFASSEEMAGPIVFLNSDMCSFVSGEEFYVDAADFAMVKTGHKEDIYIRKS